MHATVRCKSYSVRLILVSLHLSNNASLTNISDMHNSIISNQSLLKTFHFTCAFKAFYKALLVTAIISVHFELMYSHVCHKLPHTCTNCQEA